MPSSVVTIAVERWVYTLFSIACVFLIIHEVNYFSGYFVGLVPSDTLIELFDITLEANLPTWFSSALFLLCGVAAWWVALGLVSPPHPPTPSPTGGEGEYKVVSLPRMRGVQIGCWRIIAVFFLYDWVDDMAQIHERLGSFIGDAVRDHQIVNGMLVSVVREFLSYYWHILFFPLLVTMGLILLILWFNLPNHTLRMHLFVGLSCLVMAVALDYVEGLDWFVDDMRQQYASYGLSTPVVHHLLRSGEEWLEMVGAIFILAAFLGTARELSTTLLLRLK
ncbi:MAG: hypothetical protein HQL60_04550 [Magnetococcales bacterium]|nr:hypothetical protein [Magnetococcales bacterium]